jgi:hypothetical protein
MACPYADFFTASYDVGYILSPATRADLINKLLTRTLGRQAHNFASGAGIPPCGTVNKPG